MSATYDPRYDGADCARCFLRDRRAGVPVASEIPHEGNMLGAFVGEAPGEDEVEEGRPFVGRSGLELARHYGALGLARENFGFLNALACRPPGNRLKAVMEELRQVNLKRAKDKAPPLPTPFECCAPRLTAELARVPHVIPVGKEAVAAVFGKRKGEDGIWYGAHAIGREGTAAADPTWGGMPAKPDEIGGTLCRLRGVYREAVREGDGGVSNLGVWRGDQKVIATLHPAFILRSPHWRWVLGGDLARAVKFFRGEIEWWEPDLHFRPTCEELIAFLKQYRGRYPGLCVDLETDGLEPLGTQIRCVGIGDVDTVFVIPFLGIDGVTRFYSPEEEQAIWNVIFWFLESPEFHKFGHNFRYFDEMVLWVRYGRRLTIRNATDTLPMHRLTFSELQHRLGFVARSLSPTGTIPWKAGKQATRPASDWHLGLYNGRDLANNARIYMPLVELQKAARQDHLQPFDQAVQDACRTMHFVGFPIDQGGHEVNRCRLCPRGGAFRSGCAACKDYDKARARLDKEGRGDRVVDLRACWGREEWDRWLAKDAVTHLRAAQEVFGRDSTFAHPVVEDFTDEDGNFDAATWESVQQLLTEEGLDGRPFRPGSGKDLAYVLYERLGLPILEWTPDWEPSTSDDALRKLWFDKNTPDRVKDGIQHVRLYRRRVKYRGYTKGVRNAPGEKGCHLWSDGRLHPNWNATGKGSGDDGSAKTGRLTSSPNTQNWPPMLRSMIGGLLQTPGRESPDDIVIVEADGDQIELRGLTAATQCKRYLEVFQRALELPPGHPAADPHRATMVAVFGEAAVRAAAGNPCEHRDAKTGRVWWDKGSDLYADMRGLAKRVQYACFVANTRVITLGPAGNKRIADLQPGEDWTYVWAGDRCVPARIVDKRNNGKRECVRVTFRDHGVTRHEIATCDHRFMLRDGTYRAAVDLQEGDRLMPFRRFTDGSGYRTVDVDNCGHHERENRIVAGVARGDPRVVHHKNMNRTDNRPDNLEIVATNGEHTARHWAEDGTKRDRMARANAEQWTGENAVRTNARMAEGRRQSATWRAAVADPETRRAASAKSWVSGTRKKPVFRSPKLDPFADRIGKMPDREIAALAGCTPENVAHYRWQHGIETAPPVVGKVEAALDAVADRIGHETDQRIAAAVGCRRETVAAYRARHGIPNYWRMKGKPHNHEVVSVEPAGVHEVWDIEVDHEGHNFALASGIFVHNSQYGAEDQTVWRVITSAEDRSERLIYAHLTVREIADMRRKWLRGVPEIVAWWDVMQAFARRNGYVEEPVTGRRRYFLGGIDAIQASFNEIINYTIQAGCAGLINRALIRVNAACGVDFDGPGTGLFGQFHDAIGILAKRRNARDVADWLTKTMTQEAGNGVWPGVLFSAEAHVADRLNAA